jgi:hypothetical protein
VVAEEGKTVTDRNEDVSDHGKLINPYINNPVLVLYISPKRSQISSRLSRMETHEVPKNS